MTNLEKIKQRINDDPVEFFTDIDNCCPLATCKENLIYSETEIDRAEKQRYCSRCGARMDGDSE